MEYPSDSTTTCHWWTLCSRGSLSLCSFIPFFLLLLVQLQSSCLYTWSVSMCEDSCNIFNIFSLLSFSLLAFHFVAPLLHRFLSMFVVCFVDVLYSLPFTQSTTAVLAAINSLRGNLTHCHHHTQPAANKLIIRFLIPSQHD